MAKILINTGLTVRVTLLSVFPQQTLDSVFGQYALPLRSPVVLPSLYDNPFAAL